MEFQSHEAVVRKQAALYRTPAACGVACAEFFIYLEICIYKVFPFLRHHEIVNRLIHFGDRAGIFTPSFGR